MSAANRSTDQTPLTIDLVTKSLFSCFMYREPLTDNLATETYQRDDEITNMVI